VTGACAAQDIDQVQCAGLCLPGALPSPVLLIVTSSSESPLGDPRTSGWIPRKGHRTLVLGEGILGRYDKTVF